MDRDKFMKALSHDEKPMDRGRYKRIIRESIDSLQDGNPRGHHDLIICMEELAELQQALSKELRGKGRLCEYFRRGRGCASLYWIHSRNCGAFG